MNGCATDIGWHSRPNLSQDVLYITSETCRTFFLNLRIESKEEWNNMLPIVMFGRQSYKELE